MRNKKIVAAMLAVSLLVYSALSAVAAPIEGADTTPVGKSKTTLFINGNSGAQVTFHSNDTAHIEGKVENKTSDFTLRLAGLTASYEGNGSALAVVPNTTTLDDTPLTDTNNKNTLFEISQPLVLKPEDGMVHATVDTTITAGDGSDIQVNFLPIYNVYEFQANARAVIASEDNALNSAGSKFTAEVTITNENLDQITDWLISGTLPQGYQITKIYGKDGNTLGSVNTDGTFRVVGDYINGADVWNGSGVQDLSDRFKTVCFDVTVGNTPEEGYAPLIFDVTASTAHDQYEGRLNQQLTLDVAERYVYITYDGNGNTDGIVPFDENNYKLGDTVTILGTTGLTKTNYAFAGWSTTPGGTVLYKPGDTFTITSNMTLYAVWTSIGSVTTDGNESKSNPLSSADTTTASNETATSNKTAVATAPDSSIYNVFDGNGVLLGTVTVPEGKTIADMDLDENLVPLVASGTNNTDVTVKKQNPQTGDPTLMILVAVMAFTAISCYRIGEKKKNQGRQH